MSQKVTYMLLKRKQQKYIRAYIVLCLVLMTIFGGYTYKKWQEYHLVNAATVKSETYLQELREAVTEEQSSYEINKDKFDQLNKEIEKNLEDIFPVSDNYTNLTREFDEYEEGISTRNSVFEISSMNFESVVNEERYSILPVRLNIRSSAENFRKFLHFIENSGALSGNSRLMDISSIRLNFEKDNQGTNGDSEIINFTVQINAYFQ